MDKFEVDLSKVEKMLDTSRMPVKGNEPRMIRVAFDLFRVDGDETDGLWQVQADDDGNEFLVRTYSLPDEKISEASDWSVKADKKYANLTISFKGVPITRIASKDYGVKDGTDGKTLQGTIYNKLSNGEFVFKLLSTLPSTKISALKQAGLIEDIINWLESKDIVDPIVDKIKELVPEKDKKDKEEDKEEKAEDQWKLAFLELHLKKNANEVSQDATRLPSFDYTDMNLPNEEETEKYIEPEKVEEIVQQIETLEPNDLEALKKILKL